MPDKIDKGSLQEDKGRQITERPSNEPLIKSDIPDFEYTPTPPKSNTDQNTTDENKTE